MLNIHKLKSLLGSLFILGLISGCSSIPTPSEVNDEPSAAPAPEPVSHEGGMGGTGNTDECLDPANRDKKHCLKKPLP